ncbi:MAG: phosphoglycerate dehydrogenase [Thaumarchaeota archaeon]|nr:phosphoglycerate dehydrogenase [Nitrososphaerota archaeon]
MKIFIAANGRDPRFPEDIKGYLISRGVEIIENPYAGAITEDQLIELIKDADGTMASNEPYTAKVFDALPKLKIVSRVGVGFDAVDVKAATERGVIVTTAPAHELIQGMAEHTFALLLSFVKKVPQTNASLRSGEWRTGVWGKQLGDLYGLTFGLLGVGRIGSETAKRAKAFDMKLIYHDVVRREDLEKSLGMEYVSFDRLLAESDVLSIHTPLTPQTRGVINDAAFAKMKPTAILINTARGAIVDEAALVRALEQGRIAGAGIDAFSVEPLAPPHPLYKLGDRLPNLIITPHLGYGPRTGRAMMYLAAGQVLDAFAGKAPQNMLNPEVIPRRRK